ncbi:MAG: Transketolase [Candidatus Roizmanbacteria bacterium GW2011_GWC2_41_7]|uniref:Transketolase n=1 Tax=Candidatus Roizmanbacteria bacterium GW2011_GWC2_41_7 TaxID=1618487 RepID=A0A0G0X9J3_9BACT|nr:MAG: Transketolase [Candidatus Roizmanbacteria bacterium GW2011_GWC2_41_7]
MNRLGQSDPTMVEWDIDTYRRRVEPFGWTTFVLEDGHDVNAIRSAYQSAEKVKDKPQMIIAKTKKGKGVSFLEDKLGWHGKVLDAEQLKIALDELGEIDKDLRGEIIKP